MNQTFLDVMKDEGPLTIVTINAHPAGVVNTWMSYAQVDEKNNAIYIPAAGMHSIEEDFKQDNIVLLTMGSKKVMGTVEMGAGFHVLGKGSFIDSGKIYDEMKAKFPWIRKVLEVKIEKIEQKI